MSDWYRPRDLLTCGIEQIIEAVRSLEASVDRIMTESGLADALAHDPSA